MEKKDCLKELVKMPIVDYDQLAGNMKNKVEAMKYWPVDTLGEQLMRTAYSVIYIGTYDSKGQMAMDIRTVCFQFMADLEAAEAPEGYAVRELADKIKAIHERYWRIARTGGRYRG